MAHYAMLDENNVVTEVIYGRNENDLVDGITSWEEYYGAFRGQRCVRTSYNTYGNEHREGGVPFRGNYAGIGFTYDDDADAFYAPQPYPSWSLDTDTYLWEAPVPMPDDGEMYFWNEEEQRWMLSGELNEGI